MAMTQMACVDAAGIVGGFREAMKAAARFAIVGDRLELFDAAGTRVAAFTAQVQHRRRPRQSWPGRRGSS